MIFRLFHTTTVLLALSAHWTISTIILLLDKVDGFVLNVAYLNGDLSFQRALLIALLQQEHRLFNTAKANGLGFEARLKKLYSKAPEGGNSEQPRRGDSKNHTPEGGAVASASEQQQTCVECEARDDLHTFKGYAVCQKCLGATGVELLNNLNELQQELYQSVDESKDEITQEIVFEVREEVERSNLVGDYCRRSLCPGVYSHALSCNYCDHKP